MSNLPLQHFQVTFNSLSKVLFNFPSRYFFAIGLEEYFKLYVFYHIPSRFTSEKRYFLRKNDSKSSCNRRKKDCKCTGLSPFLDLDSTKFMCKTLQLLSILRSNDYSTRQFSTIINHLFLIIIFSLFLRQYSENPCWFLFFYLLICLSSVDCSKVFRRLNVFLPEISNFSPFRTMAIFLLVKRSIASVQDTFHSETCLIS